MTSIDPTTDPYAYIGITPNPDGTFTRRPEFLPTCAASTDPTNPVLSKDIPINPQTNTYARLYLPSPEYSSAAAAKLPLIVYFHGGGFVLCSPADAMSHNFCSGVAAATPAVVASVSYRLAPEHRLPAAYDDCFDALHRIGTTAAAAGDEWLTNHADLSNCFLMGTSAGGNIAYHVGLRVASRVDRLTDLKIRGLVLHQPFFGGVERCSSEMRLDKDKVLPPIVADLMWELGLPIGADRDHEYCDPIRAVGLGVLGEVRDRGWRFLVTGCDGDPLVERQIGLVKMLRESGVDVVGDFGEGGFHGLELFDHSKAILLYGVVKDFILHL